MKDTLIQTIVNNINIMNEDDLEKVLSFIHDNYNQETVENGMLNSTTFYYKVDSYYKEIVKYRILFFNNTFYYIRESSTKQLDWLDYFDCIDENDTNGMYLEDYVFKKMKFKKSYEEAKQALIEEYQELIETSHSDIEKYIKEIEKINQE